jgi:hypothetical protein
LKRLHLWVLAAACALASLLVIPGAVASSAGRASAPPTPRFDGGVHLGVTSCAGPCHGRQSASGLIEGAAVRGSELAAWQDPFSPRGAHARAYASLRTPLGRAIGANLGMADPALEPACLSCHADAAQARGPAFQISDGVGCEACHGGAGDRWIASHYGGEASYPANVADGLYPTADLQSRARLCLSCHLGAAAQDQFVSHRIMGAGLKKPGPRRGRSGRRSPRPKPLNCSSSVPRARACFLSSCFMIADPAIARSRIIPTPSPGPYGPLIQAARTDPGLWPSTTPI